MGRNGYLQLSAVVLLWSANILLVKAALPDIPPFTLTCLRFGGGVVLFALLASGMGKSLIPAAGERLELAAIGVVQVGLVTALTAVGLSFISAGRASIVLYTMQIWALPLGWWIAGDLPSRARVLGALVVCAGLAIFLSPWLVDWTDPSALFGYGILVGTGFLWAAGSCLYRRKRWSTPPLTQILWQLGFSTCLLAWLSMTFEGDLAVQWSPAVWAVLVFSWIAGAVLPYLLWAEALTVMPTSQAGQIASLVPLMVFFVSALCFGEEISPAVIASSLLIVVGIIITAAASNGRPEEVVLRSSGQRPLKSQFER
jgi:drug/metabolite transporter (DMT)-like permease